MNVYLIASYHRRHEMLGYAQQLVDAGFQVASSWVDGHHEADIPQFPHGVGENDMPPEVQARWAIADTNDLLTTDVVVCFAEPAGSPHKRGGRHVEFGIAWAMHKQIVLVGEPENAFHCMCLLQARTFDQVLEYLKWQNGDTTPTKLVALSDRRER